MGHKTGRREWKGKHKKEGYGGNRWERLWEKIMGSYTRKAELKERVDLAQNANKTGQVEGMVQNTNIKDSE